MTSSIGNHRRESVPFAEGGFARLYRAEHTGLHRPACWKENKEAHPDLVELLRQEMQTLWDLDGHHSIPAARDFYRIDANNAIGIVDFIDGKTLADIVAQHGPLHPEDASWIIERLLGALEYVHANGAIHLDVKPENVIVEVAKHDIKLIDFGLSVRGSTSASVPTGYSPRYKAPEVEEGLPPIPETDLYGAGLTYIFALGGDVMTRAPPVGTPDAIAAFCNRLVAYDPMRRPNWEKDNPRERLSDIRQEVFGRRHRR